MAPGRNDPCPCGSGKKYKKCCLGRATQTAVPPRPILTERRFFCVVTSYCTEAALAEAVRSGEMIHPYVLIKMRDDPRFLDSARPADRAKIMHLWRASKVAAMSTEEIETRLYLTGVLDYDRTGFIELAKPRESAWTIAEDWGRPLMGLNLMEQDFLGLAACELWRRLCPQRPSIEMLDDWLCEGYAFAAEQNPAEALAAWWKFWESLRPRVTPRMKNLSQAGEILFPHMSQFLSNWSGDFRMEALNTVHHNPACGEIGLRFIQEVFELLPDEDADLNLSGDMAMLLFDLHRRAEAEQICERLIRNHPDRAAGYVLLSDWLWRQFLNHGRDAPPLERAIHLLERAINVPMRDAEDYDVPARLADLRESLAKAKAGTGEVHADQI